MMTSLYSYLLCYYEGGNSATLASVGSSSSTSVVGLSATAATKAPQQRAAHGSKYYCIILFRNSIV
jgi:hypothetical protein